MEGTEFRKVRSNSRVYQRYYLLESDLQALRWEPSKKESDKARIAVSSVREVSTHPGGEQSGDRDAMNHNKCNGWGMP